MKFYILELLYSLNSMGKVISQHQKQRLYRPPTDLAEMFTAKKNSNIFAIEVGNEVKSFYNKIAFQWPSRAGCMPRRVCGRHRLDKHLPEQTPHPWQKPPKTDTPP